MEVYLKDKLFNVVIIRKNNKNIYFRIDNSLNIIVTASSKVKTKEIIKLIKKNEDALYRLYLKTINKKIKEEDFWYLGNKYEVQYLDIEQITFNKGIVMVKDENTLEKFIKEQTKEIFTYEVNELKKIINPPAFTLKLRKMKTRWGVCNYKKMTITLNTELIKYKKELLRYVIVHEMCHFYHHDHSSNFWNMVRIYYPNYKEARKELRS